MSKKALLAKPTNGDVTMKNNNSTHFVDNDVSIETRGLSPSFLQNNLTKTVLGLLLSTSFLAGQTHAAQINDVVQKQVKMGAESVYTSLPTEFTGDLADLPSANQWQPGDAIKVANPRKMTDPVGLLPAVNKTIPTKKLAKQQKRAQMRASTLKVNINKDSFDFSGAMPPDPTGDVGLKYYINAINGDGGSAVHILNKETGEQVGNVFSMASLASGGDCATGLGDPIVLFDEAAKRWLLTEFSDGSNHLCVYVAKTEDPIAGGWYAYEFLAPEFPDYPKYSVFGGNYYASANEGGGAVYALDRQKMLKGEPATMVRKTIPSLEGFGFQSITPVDADGINQPADGTPGLFIRHRDDEKHNAGTNDASKDFLELWALTPDFNTPENTKLEGPFNIAISEMDSDFTCAEEGFGCLTQKGDSQLLDPLREVVNYRAQYRKFNSHEAIVGNFITKVGDNTAALRWFELRKTNGDWSLHQEGQVDASDNNNRYMGGAALDGSGNLALAYMTTGATRLPSLALTGRKYYDDNNILTQTEQMLVEGTSFIGSDRDGDYSQLSVDPVDQCTFWFTSEYGSGDGQWKVRASSFKYEDCIGVLDPNPGFTITGDNRSQEICRAGALQPITINNSPYNNFNKSINLAFKDLPSQITGNFSANPVAAGAASKANLVVTENTPEGRYSFTITGKSAGARDSKISASVMVADGSHSSTLQSPVNNSQKQDFQPILQWNTDGYVQSAKIEIATDQAFTNIVATGAVSGGNNYRPSQALAQETQYFWRVTAKNACGETTSEIFSFTTKNPKDDYTELANGVATSLNITEDQGNKVFYIDVPDDATELKINTTAGTDGDADIYVKFDSVSADAEDFVCKGIEEGSAEECIIKDADIKAGTWYIRVRAWQAFNELNIVAQHNGTVNTPPVAVADSALVNQNSETNLIDVLANDTDADTDDTLTLVSATASAGGTVSVNDNKLTYSPKADFYGSETLTYIIKDSKDAQAEGTVTVTVNALPVAKADSISVMQDSASTLIDVLANDSDADTDDTLTLVSVSASAGGAARIASNKISYTPKAKYSGTETLTYTVKDSRGAQVQGTVSVTVKAKPKKSGGSAPLMALWLLPLMAYRQRRLGK